MVNRSSALKGFYQRGSFNAGGQAGVILEEIPNLLLMQIATWPDNVKLVTSELEKKYGIEETRLLNGRVVFGDNIALLRITPLTWWCYGAPTLFEILPQHGTSLDISHSFVHVRLSGYAVRLCLNRLIAIDLRSSNCPPGSVFSTTLHHVGVTIWHSQDGFELFIPRGFACDVWTMLHDTAEQFGLEIV